MSLSFLEASKIVAADNELGTESFVLATSGQTEKLEVFIKAASIQRGFNSDYKILPYNTLQQYVASPSFIETHHVFVLFPWDVIPEGDWRSGVTLREINEKEISLGVNNFIGKLKQFSSRSVLYVPASMLPLTCNLGISHFFELHVQGALLKEGAEVLSADFFSLSSYLSYGSPFSGKYLSQISDAIVACVPGQHPMPKKILVTDFDNVMWRGVVGEDGADDIQCSNEGAGYIHFIYQSYLLKLKSEGALIAGVTRNDFDVAVLPFRQGNTLFKERDFVSLLASYNSKSAQIQALSHNLNITLDSIIFVDDNPLEIEEVTRALPAVECLMFPEKNEDAPAFFLHLQQRFNFSRMTDEDKQRTELYKTRFKATEVSSASGADLSGYLQSLDMTLKVIKCDASNYKRALQLINKTNQFNLNGIKISEEQFLKEVNSGMMLYSYALTDKFGDHGQICSIIVSDAGVISHFAMSCRVFQRKIEYMVLLLLAESLCVEKFIFLFNKTEKNMPFQLFIGESEVAVGEEGVMLDIRLFVNANQAVSGLFNVEVVGEK